MLYLDARPHDRGMSIPADAEAPPANEDVLSVLNAVDSNERKVDALCSGCRYAISARRS
jgi:hypothetical protein